MGNKKFDIIGAPFNQLGYLKTEKNTVEGLRSTDEFTWLALSNWIDVRNTRWGMDIKDVGDITTNKSVNDAILNDQNEKALGIYCDELKSKLLNSFEAGRTPITIGGDHSIAVGTVQAALEHYQKNKNERVAVVWVDAHADCNSSLDSNLHGKPLAMLMNEYRHNGWSVPTESQLSSDQVFYIGVRDLMLNEFEFISNSSVTNYDMTYLDTHGIQSVLADLMSKIDSQFDRVYLSFDYDALDGSIFRACATPNIGGLSAREALHLVHTIASSPKFIGADFVEYMPELDEKSISKELMVKLIDAVWGFRA
ncbi:arginase family protein [Vibrio sp. MarTm2]|uniref:arginase family protein n=1 Tax=Vibrio sp. MarTm2 TaxID=2998831 RepID=UPI0022CD8B60|nr:arginase family protein [Vibrio sp. MarTm2]MDA0130658.1 arginase family protein [Vibrio sp. MarTm2]